MLIKSKHTVELTQAELTELAVESLAKRLECEVDQVEVLLKTSPKAQVVPRSGGWANFEVEDHRQPKGARYASCVGSCIGRFTFHGVHKDGKFWTVEWGSWTEEEQKQWVSEAVIESTPKA